jgi:hypothetical protein
MLVSAYYLSLPIREYKSPVVTEYETRDLPENKIPGLIFYRWVVGLSSSALFVITGASSGFTMNILCGICSFTRGSKSVLLVLLDLAFKEFGAFSEVWLADLSIAFT